MSGPTPNHPRADDREYNYGMKRTEALALVESLEKLISNSFPGKSEDAIKNIRKTLLMLRVGLRLKLQTYKLMDYAETFYSARKWERRGSDSVRTSLVQEVARLRYRIDAAPDSVFD